MKLKYSPYIIYKRLSILLYKYGIPYPDNHTFMIWDCRSRKPKHILGSSELVYETIIYVVHVCKVENPTLQLSSSYFNKACYYSLILSERNISAVN